MARGFSIDLDSLDYNLRHFDDRARAAIKKTLQYQAPRSENYMRTNAPWTDRTTNARNGLFAQELDVNQDSWLLLLSHTVHYGIWLEIRNSGQYAIIRPSWLKANKEVMQLLSKLFARMEKGK